MKSKIYSSRYMQVSSKGLTWIPAFVTIGFLLAFPVAELIMLGNWFGMGYSIEQTGLLYENLWRDGFMLTGLVIVALAALFNGISQFGYLYFPRKVDFYHSLPVKRSRMFWYKTLQSLLFFLIPYLAMEFFAICIGAMRGFFSLHLMTMAFIMLAFHLLLYLLLYFSVVLVICLTGHFLMGALLLVAVAAYGPTLSILIRLYEGAFYYTCYDSSVSYGITKALTELTSPVMLAYTFSQKYAEGSCGSLLLFVILLTAVLGVLGFYAFVYRKSEKTGQAFVYKRAGMIVRFLVVVPTGLGVGMIFYLLPTDASRMVWWIFGMIFGTFLVNGIMGILYYRDFRKFFSHKLQFVISSVCVAVLACIFSFDLTGYDKYIPSYNKIENIALGISQMGYETWNNIEIKDDGTVTLKESDGAGGNVVNDNIGISQGIYKVMERIVNENEDICKSLSDNVALSTNLWDNSGNTIHIPVRYDLKSGSSVYRSYMIDRENLKVLLEKSYEQGTLKEERYSILGLDNKYLEQVQCDFVNGKTISLFQDNKAKREQLIDAFREDVKEADAKVLNGTPCANLMITYANVPSLEEASGMVPGAVGDYYFSSGFYVYPQFKRTVEILKETGYPLSMEDVKLTSVEASYFMDENGTDYSSPVVYDKEEQLEVLKKVLKCYQMVPLWEKRETDMWGNLKVMINGQESDEYWVILEKDVPEFMKEDYERAQAFEILE